MKILLRNSIAFLLIFTMVFTLGVSSFSEDISFQERPLEIFSGDDKTVAEDVYGEEDIGIGGGGNIGDIDISDNNGGTVAEDVYGGGAPIIDTLEYTVRYFIDSIEVTELEFTSEVPIEEPIVEDIPYYDLLEKGYVLDELKSTELPFMVTEEDRLIDAHFILDTPGVLEYKVNYYFTTPDGEDIQGVIFGEVDYENPTVTVDNLPVPEELPEGYVVDEELSTLPFEVTEKNNVIEVYFIPIPEEGAMLDNMPPTPHTDMPEDHIIKYAPGSLGSALSAERFLRTMNSNGLEPGEVRTSKAATPVPGMVNTWDITVRVEGRDDNKVETTDIVLVIDRSGSMSDNSRMANAKSAAKNFIDAVIPADPNVRIAIVSFSSRYTNQGYTSELVTTNHGFSRSQDTLKDEVDKLIAHGGTHTQAGIIRGQSLLTGSDADNKYMVLLSDGQPTYSYEPINWQQGDARLDWWGNPNGWHYYGIYDGNYNASSIVGTGSDLTGIISYGSNRYHIDNGAAAIKAGQDARDGINGLFTIAVEAGNEGTSILGQIASPGMAYSTQNPEDLQEIYDKIGTEIATQSAIKDAVIVDEMGDGFTLIESTLGTSQGSATVAQAGGSKNQEITWSLGSSVVNPVSGSTDIRYAEMTYRVEINNDILDIVGAKTDQSKLFKTNKFTKMTYKDINDNLATADFTSPEVDPVLLKIKKILPSPMEEENRIFNVEISKVAPNGFNHTEGLVPNADYVWLTTLRHEGTYTVSETGITGNGVTDLGKYEIFYNINETSQQSFQVDHIDGKPRGDVAIEVTNKQFGEDTPSDEPLIRVSKTFVGLTQAQINQLTDFKIKITSSSDSSMTRDLLLSEGTRYDEANGDITYKWEIKGWPAGTYIIDETGEKLTNYTVEIEYYPLGGGNSGQVTTVPPTVNLLKDIVRWTSVKAAGIYNLKYSDGAIPNLIVVKLTGNAGAFIWSDIQYSEPQRQAIVSYLQSEANYLNVEMNKTFWYSDDSFYHRGEFKYNINNGDLTIPASNQWSQIAYLGYEFEGGYPADIAVKNTYTLQTTDVTIKKEVTGNFGDLTRQFAFNVIAKKGKENQQTFDFDLSNGQTETLKNIPKNATLILTEESGTYAVTVKVGGSNIVANQDGSYTIDLANYESGITISVTNHKDVVIDTGITFDSMPYILILSLATIGLGTTVVRKRNIRKED